MKRILLVDLAERELQARTQLRGSSAKPTSSKPATADAPEKPASGKKKSAAKVPAKQALDAAFTRRIRQSTHARAASRHDLIQVLAP